MTMLILVAATLTAGLAGGETHPPGFSPLHLVESHEHGVDLGATASGSQLLSAAGGRVWVLEPGQGRVVIVAPGGGRQRTIPLPWPKGEDAHPRVLLLAAYAAEGAWLWDASAGEGYHWRQGRWQGPFRASGQVAALIALPDGRAVVNTPAHPEGSFAVFNAQGAVERRFGQPPALPHPLLAPHYDSWVLVAVENECVAANRYLPRLVRFRLDGSIVWQRIVTDSGLDRLEASRQRALRTLREDCGSGCIDAQLVEFATAGQGFADGGFVLNYSRRHRLDWFGPDGSWRGSARLNLPADSSPQPLGMGFVGQELFLATPTQLLRLQPAPTEGWRVVNERGEGVAGAAVRLSREGHQQLSLTTDDEGRFAPPATWANAMVVVEVTAEGFLPLRRTGPLAELLADDLVLERLPQVCFRVTDRSSGRPIAEFGAQLRRRVEELESVQLAPGSPQQQFTAPDGRGCLASTLPAPLELLVSAAGYASRRMRVAGGEELEVALAPEARLTLTVRTHQGDPVEKASVTLWPDAVAARPVRVSDLVGTTDVSGQWHLAGLQPGRYQAEIRCEQHPKHSEMLTLEEGDNEVAVRLPAGTEVSFAVTEAEELPIADVKVAVASLQPAAEWLECVTDRFGRCSVAGVPEGSARAVVEVPSGRQVEQRFTATGERLEVRVRLPGGGRVQGSLRGIERYPDMPLEVIATREEWAARVVAGSDGSFTLDSVPRGRVIFRVTGGDRSPATLVQAARDVGEGTTFVELQLPPPLRVSGVVRRGAKPCSACELVFAPITSPHGRVSVACQLGGTYSAHLPVPGDYGVTISDTDTGQNWVRTLTVRRDTTWDVELDGAVIEGVVVDGTSQAPVAGVLVRLLAAAGGLVGEQRSGDDGAFRFVGVAPGTVRLVAESEGRIAERNLAVRGGVYHELLELAPGRLLRLRLVAGQSGRAVHGAVWASLHDPRGGWRPLDLFSSRDGDITIPTNHGGEHTVVVHVPPFAVTTVHASAGDQPLTVVLWPPALVQVEGVGSEALQVQFLAPGGRPVGLGAIPPRFAATGRGMVRVQVPPGVLTAVVEVPEQRAVHRFPLTLRPEEHRVLNLPR